MNKIQLIVTAVMFLMFLTGCACGKSSVKKNKANESTFYEWPKQEQQKPISELGVVYVGMDKEHLKKAGYSRYMLKDYIKEAGEEWLIFDNWKTKIAGDVIAFHLTPKIALKCNLWGYLDKHD